MNHQGNSFSQKIELLVLVIVIFILVILSNLPYITGYFVQDDKKFSGAVFDRPDYAVHLSALQSGLRGHWDYQSHFTSEPVTGVYIKLTYVILGNLWRLFSLPVDYYYHLLRNILFLILCGIIYITIAKIFQRSIFRILAFWIVICGSGMGWFQYLVGPIPNPQISPIDFWFMDGYIFFGSMVFPHFSLSSICLIGTVGLILALNQRGYQWWIWFGMALLVVISTINQPFILVLIEILLTSGCFYLYKKEITNRKEIIKGFIFITLLAGIGFGYNLYVLNAYSFWKIFTKQNITLSPPLSYYLWGYAGLWAVTIIGSLGMIYKKRLQSQSVTISQSEELAFLLSVVWCIGGLFLSYLPIVSQRRFMHAYTFPLGVLAVWGVSQIAQLIPLTKLVLIGKRFWIYITILWIVLSTIGTVYISIGKTIVIGNKDHSFFDPNSLVSAVDWLKDNANEDDVILAMPQTSYLIAERTGLRVYGGHFVETIDYHNKQGWIDGFYSGIIGWNDVLEKKIQWVIVGPYEKRMGIKSAPNLDEFRLRYNSSDVTIYQVLP